jgi:hypothetical protein
MPVRSPSFARSSVPSNKQIEVVLLPFFRNQPSVVRQILTNLRIRMPTDEEIINHIRILNEDHWSSWQIGKTLLKLPYPTAQELVQQRNILVSIGFEPDEAIRFIISSKNAFPRIADSSTVLDQKIRIAFNGNKLPLPISDYCINGLHRTIRASIEELEVLHQQLEVAKTSPERWVLSFFKLQNIESHSKKANPTHPQRRT